MKFHIIKTFKQILIYKLKRSYEIEEKDLENTIDLISKNSNYKIKNLTNNNTTEDILNILPKGTHDYEKLIKPSELLTYIDKGGLDFSEIKGMTYIPFFDIVKLSNDPSVNYIIHARKK